MPVTTAADDKTFVVPLTLVPGVTVVILSLPKPLVPVNVNVLTPPLDILESVRVGR